MRVLKGYDNKGILYDAGDQVVRKIAPEYFEAISATFEIYTHECLFEHGIVATEINQSAYSLSHEKHIISYPYEWTVNMYKDAVLFHLKLFLDLEAFGLTLKDALPNNILFSGTKTVFVDFPSLVRIDRLHEEHWLFEHKSYTDPRFAVVDRMLIPNILVPLMAMASGKFSIARLMLSDKACNCGGGIPMWRDLGAVSWPLLLHLRYFRPLKKIIYPVFSQRSKQIFEMYGVVAKRQTIGFIQFISELSSLIDSFDFTPRPSNYLPYYEDKKGDFDFDNRSYWKEKQHNIFKLIEEYRPKTVLDLGANTGWFSILAARHGASVISTDIDESSIDALFVCAKSNGLNILPLLISFDNLTREIYGENIQELSIGGRDYSKTPLFLPATRRLKSEMVLCLGLLHHLVLGMGKNISDAIKILSDLTLRTLVLEFVSINDSLIQADPAFFKNIRKYSTYNYNIEIVITEGRKYFEACEIMTSDSETRKLLVFRRN